MNTEAPNLWLTCLVSLVVAAAVFVIFVLPAEYGEDPTGLGEAMGLTSMAGFDVQALSAIEHPMIEDEVEFVLAPFESVEYKYVMAVGEGIVFTWDSAEEVVYDMHSEEEGTDPEDSVSFAVGRGSQLTGTFIAPFTGKHGWFWENRGSAETVVRLTVRGFVDSSITYSPAGEYKRSF